MTKKRLSDLLQEEAQKLSPSEGETTIDVDAVADDNSSTSSDSDTENEEETQQAAETTTSKRTTPTKAELEATVKELKEALEKAQKKETSLVKQLKNTLEKTQQNQASVVNELKETMEKTQKKEASVVKQLKETLEKAQEKEASLQQQITDLELDVSKHKILAASLKTELDDAKKAAIQLAEANSQLTETITTLQQPKQNALVPKTYKKSYPLAQRLPEGRPITKDNDSDDNSSPMWLLD
ncbi:hypothetical protein DP113_30140 [Brasilonema octagenarum UFV-E1]|uniref:Uncharacterized protein n=1 Tax=Brasilonema sennae CENA114 TaxID=415709 RepID=A0A856MR61_9CYAN|nr:hypothetical protein [Brasilonema sennae]QDL11566.1 hypothetical protein DP114_29985 [Brasilonema sennae CENA114]QDL17946.1 hypothetical protein DP113_30140 [Brasilonema octagenarum UFV-E1]